MNSLSLPFGKQSADQRDCIEVSWACVDLGIELSGRIDSDAEGHQFLQSEINRPNIKNSELLAEALMRAIAAEFDISGENMRLKLRLVELDENILRPQIHLIVAGKRCPDVNRLNKLIAEFSEKISLQSDLIDSIDESENSESLSENIDSHINDFLQVCGGQIVKKPISVLVNDHSVATIRGAIAPAPDLNQDTEKSIDVTIRALYDGRRLRYRTMYVKLPHGRQKCIPIYYDEERFDQLIRDIGDNKNVMLEMVCRKTILGRSSEKFELRSLSQIPIPAELMLTSDTDIAG